MGEVLQKALFFAPFVTEGAILTDFMDLDSGNIITSKASATDMDKDKMSGWKNTNPTYETLHLIFMQPRSFLPHFAGQNGGGVTKGAVLCAFCNGGGGFNGFLRFDFSVMSAPFHHGITADMDKDKMSGWKSTNPTYEKLATDHLPVQLFPYCRGGCCRQGLRQNVGLDERQPDLRNAGTRPSPGTIVSILSWWLLQTGFNTYNLATEIHEFDFPVISPHRVLMLQPTGGFDHITCSKLAG